MGLIEDELEEVRKLCERTVCNSRLVSCVKTMVRIEIKRTSFKTIIICIQFPSEYPNVPLLLELKSKTLADKLLTKLTDVCEVEMKKILGKPQIMMTLKFINTFISENPLCCCYNEIDNIKKLLTGNDELKLRQKSSSILLKIISKLYYLKVKCLIPENYPEKSVSIEDLDTNFPPIFQKYIFAQSKEYSRQCVEPPLRKLKPNEPPFTPKPSLEKIVSFLIDCIKRLPTEKCPLCGEQCFPDNPEEVITDESSVKHVERLYCGHVLHNGCLVSYMRKPPFGNKRCKQCKQKIFHDKWGVTDKLAEDRWAHEQARERELAEVTDFFQEILYVGNITIFNEYSRQCVEPPLRKLKPNEPPFTPKPSLEKIVSFLIDCIKRLPTEKCTLCGEQCFPDNPEEVITDESSVKHVERLYCGHVLHNGCLVSYMRKPPFGNKRCKQCKQKIFHDKWGVTDKLAEDRWAHEQARERELAEVTDFFQ